MNNFIFYNPTRLLFGKGMINQLTQQIPADKRIMITFGGGSVKTNGVYEPKHSKDVIIPSFGELRPIPI